jgi:hypothetical protein
VSSTSLDPPELSREDLAGQPDLATSRVRRRALTLAVVVVVVVAVIALVPGLAGLRSRFAHAEPAWLLAGAALKVLSGLG